MLLSETLLLRRQAPGFSTFPPSTPSLCNHKQTIIMQGQPFIAEARVAPPTQYEQSRAVEAELQRLLKERGTGAPQQAAPKVGVGATAACPGWVLGAVHLQFLLFAPPLASGADRCARRLPGF